MIGKTHVLGGTNMEFKILTGENFNEKLLSRLWRLIKNVTQGSMLVKFQI